MIFFYSIIIFFCGFYVGKKRVLKKSINEDFNKYNYSFSGDEELKEKLSSAEESYKHYQSMYMNELEQSMSLLQNLSELDKENKENISIIKKHDEWLKKYYILPPEYHLIKMFYMKILPRYNNIISVQSCFFDEIYARIVIYDLLKNRNFDDFLHYNNEDTIKNYNVDELDEPNESEFADSDEYEDEAIARQERKFLNDDFVPYIKLRNKIIKLSLNKFYALKKEYEIKIPKMEKNADLIISNSWEERNEYLKKMNERSGVEECYVSFDETEDHALLREINYLKQEYRIICNIISYFVIRG